MRGDFFFQRSVCYYVSMLIMKVFNWMVINEQKLFCHQKHLKKKNYEDQAEFLIYFSLPVNHHYCIQVKPLIFEV